MFERAGELQKIFREQNEKELQQLAELMEMQQALDMAIMKEREITVYPEDNIEIALFTELGELMNEFPTIFKYWKTTAKDDREKGLIEYVDCIHFAISLLNYKADNAIKALLSQQLETYDYSYELDSDYSTFDIHYLLQEITTENAEIKICHLFDLGKILGFTWDEIYNAYIDKNKVNYERLRGGY